MYNQPGSICPLRNWTAWTLSRCITGQPVTQPDTLSSTWYATGQDQFVRSHNWIAWTPSRCITGQPVTQVDTLGSAPMYNRPGSISLFNNWVAWLLAHCATGLKCILMITMHSYRYLTLKTLLPLSKSFNAVLGHDHASYPVMQRAVQLRNGPSNYASGQGLGIRAEHI